jgi:hypothetical protein
MARITFFGIALLCLLGLAAPLHAQKNEATLISAWEQEQKADPSTLKFEKLADRKYHFATKRFPFDGELLIRNVSIREFSGEDDFGVSSGTVEIELQNINENFYRTYAMSYGNWMTGNTFYWDAKSQRWLTAEQNMKQLREGIPRIRPFWSICLAQGWLVIFLVILLVLLVPLFRYSRRWKEITARTNRSLGLTERAIQLSERNVQLQEEHAKLLQEIRDLLNK